MIENRRTIFLESNEFDRLYLLHRLFAVSWALSVTDLSVRSEMIVEKQIRYLVVNR